MESSDLPLKDRRGFLKTVAGTVLRVTLVGVVTPMLDACGTSDSTGVGGGSSTAIVDVTGLTEDGQALVVNTRGLDGAPVLVVRRSATEFLAMSMRCTHQGCTVNAPSSGVLFCPCHGSQFDLQGAVLRGPANQALRRYVTTLDDATKQLTVTFA